MKNGLVINDAGTQFWYKDGLLHRDDDLPAIIYANGSRFWFQNGFGHRENGPTSMYVTGENFWWFHGERFTFDEWCIATNKSPKEKAFLMLQYMD